MQVSCSDATPLASVSAVPRGVASEATALTANVTGWPGSGVRDDASVSVAVMVTCWPTTGDDSDFSMMRYVGGGIGVVTGPVRANTAWRMLGSVL